MAASKALLVMNKTLELLLSRFPDRKNCSLAFAYGSGVFRQAKNNEPKKNMIDFVIVVDDSLAWHSENLIKNRADYSFLKYGSAKLIKYIQENYGANMYFNTLIPAQDKMIKYGVISTKDLLQDLKIWNTLYASGRLHKPVNFIYKPSNQELIEALNTNLKSAIHAALLCLPEAFTKEQLFIKVSELSYTGDFRMLFGEDKNKVQNIVHPNLDAFSQLYEPVLKSMNDLHITSEGIEHDCSSNAKLHHLTHLPKTVRLNITTLWNRDGYLQDMEDVLFAISQDPNCKDFVLKAIREIVWKYSWKQSLKGLLTAGLLKSTKYSAQKIMKMVSGSRNPNSYSTSIE
ncbi:LOW QUALITY PROTEIN: phosphatidate cytidylyltransferase, mitochondrial [Centruroides vittatus]|uniref:LOW QUALITY PROTEIN: phosphatidate cytidylyltransferase, mitochondrial n=1 Tax=Centruroides vittatus TaxID=120091 RepID=UPI003510270D